MTPTKIITYIYGSGVKTVTVQVDTTEKQDHLRVQIIDPPILTKFNQINGTKNKDALTTIIKPQDLFKSYDGTIQDAEMAFTPIRYKHVIISSILKQYLRENLFIGELEAEVGTPTK